MVGTRQADLAREIGISASYLNLIEHNRRRIGGKLLLNIARALGVEPASLSEGAEAALIATLREAAVGTPMPAAELERADEFAGRFPGWAQVLANAHRRVGALERTVESLTDRLAHDPQLAASLHELLSTAAAIRSTASILAENKDLSDEWRNRFHANMDQDSRRLSDSSKALVGYLDADADDGAEGAEVASSPQEEVDSFLHHNGYSFPDLEAGVADVEQLITDAPQLGSMASKHLARGVLEQTRSDARLLKLSALSVAVGQGVLDPLALARRFSLAPSVILRRLASLPSLTAGFVVCDRAGSLVFRKPVNRFAVPRFGAACPLWPMFDALSAPGSVRVQRVRQVGRNAATFTCFAFAEQRHALEYNVQPLMQGMMLIVPDVADAGRSEEQIVEVGSNCRVCARVQCPGRREPSILSEGF